MITNKVRISLHKLASGDFRWMVHLDYEDHILDKILGNFGEDFGKELRMAEEYCERMNIMSRARALAERMVVPVKKNFPSQKIDINKWSDAIRKLFEIDKKTEQEIIEVWQYVINHDGTNGFSWRQNCRSPMKLRERKDGLPYFDIIQSQMRNANRQRF